MTDAILVIGGGIAGIQAATDLAAQGFPVTLVERSNRLGGRLAEPHLKHLYAFLCENRHIETLRGCDESCLPFYAKKVLAKIRASDPTWEDMVPPQVARMIQERRLFHTRSAGG